MKCKTHRLGGVLCALAPLLPVFLPVAGASESVAANVNGTLTEIDGIPVLRVWGTPPERGYAHGFLLAEQIVPLVDGFLGSGGLGNTIEFYEQIVLPRIRLMMVEPEYDQELRGLLKGIEARRGGPAEIPFLKRPLRYEDLVAINCTPDFRRSGCSSFAAWGTMTEDGHTLAGRNMDWPAIPAMLDTQIILVNVPPPGSGKLGFVTVTWPMFLGCLTAMNAEGVTVSTHDAAGHTPSVRTGFAPYSLTFREAVESAHAETAIADITQVLRKRISIVGNNMMVTRPYTGAGPGAVVLEFDGDLSDGEGLTIREPESPDPYQVCTNHFRLRTRPISCDRYQRLAGTLERIANSEGKHHVTPERAWKMLKGVSFETILTYHSVVFEPNKRLIHVAFTKESRHAPRCKVVTLDVEKLLAGAYPGGR